MIHTANDLRAMAHKIAENRTWDGVDPRSATTQLYYLLEDVDYAMRTAVNQEKTSCEYTMRRDIPNFDKMRDAVIKRMASGGFHMDVTYGTLRCKFKISW